MNMSTQQNTLAIQRIKDGAIISDLDGTIYKYLGSKQIIDGYDSHGAEYAEIKRVYRSQRLLDNRIFRFGGQREVILLEGDQLW